LGEHLLCKQGVVGSIPIASMALRRWRVGGLVVTAIGLGSGRVRVHHCCWAGCAAWGLMVFFGDCESGSGAFLDAQDVSVGLGGIAVRFGRAWEVRDGLAWVSDLWLWVRAGGFWAASAECAETRVSADVAVFRGDESVCVLSEWLCCGTEA